MNYILKVIFLSFIFFYIKTSCSEKQPIINQSTTFPSYDTNKPEHNTYQNSFVHRYQTGQVQSNKSAATIQNESLFLSGYITKMNNALENNVNKNCSDKHGNTALHLTAYRRAFDFSSGKKNQEMIPDLIKMGVNPYAKNKAGLTYQDILRINSGVHYISLHEINSSKK